MKPAAPRNPEACRPLAQFLYQVDRELEWLKDELEVDNPHGGKTLDEIARKNVRQKWIDRAIWRPEWWRAGVPGSSWYHEAVNHFLLIKPPPPPALPRGVFFNDWREPEGMDKNV